MLVILKSPPHLRRGVALTATFAGTVLLDAGFGPTPGLAWFAPASYIKLLSAHANREAPFAAVRWERWRIQRL